MGCSFSKFQNNRETCALQRRPPKKAAATNSDSGRAEARPLHGNLCCSEFGNNFAKFVDAFFLLQPAGCLEGAVGVAFAATGSVAQRDGVGGGVGSGLVWAC